MVNQCLEFAGWHPTFQRAKIFPWCNSGWQTLGFVQHAVARQFQSIGSQSAGSLARVQTAGMKISTKVIIRGVSNNLTVHRQLPEIVT